MGQQGFDWSTYLNLAEALAKASSEASHRTAIGRAYYYIFHLAHQRLIENEFMILTGENSHRQVWEKFEADDDFRCRKLATAAKNLKEKRERADYESTYPKLVEDVAAIITSAKRFATDLSGIPGLPVNKGVKSSNTSMR